MYSCLHAKQSTNAPVLSAGVFLLICTAQAKGTSPWRKRTEPLDSAGSLPQWSTWVGRFWQLACTGQFRSAPAATDNGVGLSLTEFTLDHASVLGLQWNDYCCNLVLLGKKPHQDNRRIKLQKTTLRAPAAGLSWTVDRNPFAGVLFFISWLQVKVTQSSHQNRSCQDCHSVVTLTFINISAPSWRASPPVSSTTIIALFQSTTPRTRKTLPERCLSMPLTGHK